MHLKLFVPTDVLVDEDVAKVVCEAENGSFGMLPRHIDFAATLVPGVLIYETAEGTERFVGIDQGALVKQGEFVLVSARNAVPGDDLGRLRRVVEERFIELDDRERSARMALARLEAGMVRRFIELED